MYVKTPVITVLHNYFYSHWQKPDNHGNTWTCEGFTENQIVG